jgi:Ca2+-transporting ATPase
LQFPIEEDRAYETWYAREKIGISQEEVDAMEDEERTKHNKDVQKQSGVAKLLQTVQQIKILAECTPDQKRLFVKGFRYFGAAVLMAGESITDEKALKDASVGVSLAEACDVAKDNADLVLMQNDFKYIKASVMWGRQLYANVKKFLVFQLTINVVVILTSVIGGAIGHVPFNVLQMLWINLIMDILGAIALCTEPWAEGVKLARVKRT